MMVAGIVCYGLAETVAATHVVDADVREAEAVELTASRHALLDVTALAGTGMTLIAAAAVLRRHTCS
jgi:hypothetical protein